MRCSILIGLLLGLWNGTMPLAAEDDPPKNPNAVKKDEREKKRSDGELFEQAMTELRAAGKADKIMRKRHHYEQAISHLQLLTKQHPDSRLWGIAKFNSGVFLCDYLDRPKDAIGKFEALIANKNINDKDATGDLMRPYRNYRYHARRMIITCRSQLGQYDQAVLAAFEMKKAYVTHCGTCQANMMRYFERRLVEVCHKWLLKRKGKTLVEGEKDALTEAVKNAKNDPTDAFLLALGKHYRDRNQPNDAKLALQLLLKSFPKSKYAVEAKRLLETRKKGRDE